MEQTEIGRAVFRKIGRERHAANLNFEYCFSYERAKDADFLLLVKTNDFSQKDVERVVLGLRRDAHKQITRTLKGNVPFTCHFFI